MRNFVFEAAEAYYHKDGKVNEVKLMQKEATERFPMVLILISIAYTETLKAIDVIDERNMRKHLVKMHLKKFEESYATYHKYLRAHMNDDAWGLLWDYSRMANNKIGGKILLLRQACYNYLKKNDVKECKLLAQCEVAVLLWKIYADTFKAYFRSYKEACGVDLSGNFTYANLSVCKDRWELVTDELASGVKGIDFNNDRRCRDAWNDLQRSMDNIDFFHEAARRALNLGEGRYDKYLKETKKEGS